MSAAGKIRTKNESNEIRHILYCCVLSYPLTLSLSLSLRIPQPVIAASLLYVITL